MVGIWVSLLSIDGQLKYFIKIYTSPSAAYSKVYNSFRRMLRLCNCGASTFWHSSSVIHNTSSCGGHTQRLSPAREDALCMYVTFMYCGVFSRTYKITIQYVTYHAYASGYMYQHPLFYNFKCSSHGQCGWWPFNEVVTGEEWPTTGGSFLGRTMFSDWWLSYHLWNCHQVNVNIP